MNFRTPISPSGQLFRMTGFTFPGWIFPSFTWLQLTVLTLYCYQNGNQVGGASVVFPVGSSQIPVQLLSAAVSTSENIEPSNRSGHNPPSGSLTSGSDDVLLSAADSLLSSSYATPVPLNTVGETTPLTVNHPAPFSDESQPATPSTLSVPSSLPRRKNASNCYFPSEYQGIYQVQSSIDPQGRVQYDQVEIGPQDISVWGTCHSLMGQHVLLHTGNEGGNCYRCIHVSMRTPTIIQLNPTVEELQSICYTNEEAALSKCPSPATIKPGNGTFLWRKSGSIEPSTSSTGQNIYRSLCPLEGEFTLKYYLNGRPLCETGNSPGGVLESHNNGTRIINRRSVPNLEQNDYEQPLSIISTCPSRDILHATFRSCEITDRETSYKCLGTWPGENGESYIGLMDFYDDSYAKYRCALYKEEKYESIVEGYPTIATVFHVSLSPDSSCNNELENATHGYETLSLFPVTKFNKRKIKAKIWDLKRRLSAENAITAGIEEPSGSNKPFGRLLFAGGKNPGFSRPLKSGYDGMEENATCRFAEWMQGEWQYFSVKADDLSMRTANEQLLGGNNAGLKTTANQDFLCIGRDVKTVGQDEKILLYSQTMCGEESVSCLWVRKKGSGMMEFRKGQPIPFSEATLLKRHTGAALDSSVQTPTFPPFDICEDSFFHGSPWVTQINLRTAEKLENVQAACPFSGELEASVGSGEKCAAFSSHCGSPDIFEYKLRSCKTPSAPTVTYDERHYRCVSTWRDAEYTMFLTERLKGEEIEAASNPMLKSSNASKREKPLGNLETQCFVMKVLPELDIVLIASLSSNCKYVSLAEPSWEEHLRQSGLRFKLTANCSSTAPKVNSTSAILTSNEIPELYHYRPKLRPYQGHVNETDENFNTISSARTSGTSSAVRRKHYVCIYCLFSVIGLLFTNFKFFI